LGVILQDRFLQVIHGSVATHIGQLIHLSLHHLGLAIHIRELTLLPHPHHVLDRESQYASGGGSRTDEKLTCAMN
jgi:hypothetical protein